MKELKSSIDFFEESSRESSTDFSDSLFYNPSEFCLPFYRSFYMIIHSKKQQAKYEVEKYLDEAKNAIKGSKNKKLLLEAVENLSKALEEANNFQSIDLEDKKRKLDIYRTYCEQASELMNETEITAPLATDLIRKGLPIFDRKLKSLLEEIQEKAKIACQASQGTDTEDIACVVNREIQKWEIASQEEMSWYVNNLVFTLESTIPKLPENQSIFDKIEQIREERMLERQYAIICSIVPLIPWLHMERDISDIKKSVDEVNKKATVIIKKIEEIQEELKEGFEKLDKLSTEIGGREGECIKIFSEKLLEVTKKGDSKTIERFLEELLKDESSLIKEIDSSSASENEKEESKRSISRSISKLRSLLEKVKNPTKAFGKDVAKEIVVGYAAKGIIELVIPMMFLAVFGVPMPSHIVEILTIVTNQLKELPQSITNPKNL